MFEGPPKIDLPPEATAEEAKKELRRQVVIETKKALETAASEAKREEEMERALGRKRAGLM